MNAHPLLAPFSRMFGVVVAARGKLYETGVFKSYDLGVSVVSVGNLTVGGTGKTPLVAFVARVFAENGHRVFILTRGYKRANPYQRVLVSDGEQILADVKTAGDEPFELANQLLGVAAVIADKKRFEAGLWARENLGATAFVLDDGFQHQRLKRNLDLVAIDATNPFGNGHLLPNGILREPVLALKRAHCIVITRADLSDNIENLKTEVSNLNPNSLILAAKTKIIKLKELKEFSTKPHGDQLDLQNLKSKAALAFCALGNPRAFFDSLRRAHFVVKDELVFPDHHVYAQADVEKIKSKAEQVHADVLLTTAKDAVKLTELNFNLPCLVVEIDVVFDDEEPLRQLIAAL